jgi:hypothetical protein
MTAPTARPAAPPTGRPVILDAYSGAGGAAVGYHRAGFDVVGVDIVPQPRYPFAFEQGDAIEFIRRHGRDFDAIHASPVCKGFTRARHMHGGESGANHRPCDREWARELRDQCAARGVPYFFKQWGGLTPKSGGRLLDGRTWDQFPAARVTA